MPKADSHFLNIFPSMNWAEFYSYSYFMWEVIESKISNNGF